MGEVPEEGRGRSPLADLRWGRHEKGLRFPLYFYSNKTNLCTVLKLHFVNNMLSLSYN